MVWLILVYSIKVVIVGSFYACRSIINLGKLRIWIVKEHISIFYDGLFEQIKGAELVLLISASIQLSRIV